MKIKITEPRKIWKFDLKNFPRDFSLKATILSKTEASVERTPRVHQTFCCCQLSGAANICHMFATHLIGQMNKMHFEYFINSSSPY